MSLSVGAGMAIAGAASLAAGGLSAGTTIAANKLNYSQNKRLMQMQNQMNIENWERENAYNSPVAQMQRFEEAGLNPNLIYGQQNTGGSIPSVGLQHANNQPVDMSFVGDSVNNALATYQDMRLKQAQINGLESQIAQREIQTAHEEIKKARTEQLVALDKLKAEGVVSDNQYKALKTRLFEDTFEEQKNIIKSQSNILAENALKAHEEIELVKQNVNKAKASIEYMKKNYQEKVRSNKQKEKQFNQKMEFEVRKFTSDNSFRWNQLDAATQQYALEHHKDIVLQKLSEEYGIDFLTLSQVFDSSGFGGIAKLLAKKK